MMKYSREDVSIPIRGFELLVTFSVDYYPPVSNPETPDEMYGSAYVTIERIRNSEGGVVTSLKDIPGFEGESIGSYYELELELELLLEREERYWKDD